MEESMGDYITTDYVTLIFFHYLKSYTVYWIMTSFFSAVFLPSVSWKVIEKSSAFSTSEEISWEQEDLRGMLKWYVIK